jgi:hypothetical protein
MLYFHIEIKVARRVVKEENAYEMKQIWNNKLVQLIA